MVNALLRAHVAPLPLAAGYIREQRRRGERVVLAFVAGAALERAHVEYLRAAAALGTCVAVATWESALVPDRVEILAGLRGVDLVIPQALPIDLLPALEALRPAIFATRERAIAVRERAACDRLGIEVRTNV